MILRFRDIAELSLDQADDYAEVAKLAACLIDCGVVPPDTLYEIVVVGGEGTYEVLKPVRHGFLDDRLGQFAGFGAHYSPPPFDGDYKQTIKKEARQITPGREYQPLPCSDLEGQVSKPDPVPVEKPPSGFRPQKPLFDDEADCDHPNWVA